MSVKKAPPRAHSQCRCRNGYSCFYKTFPERLTVVIGGKPEKSQEGARLILLFTLQFVSRVLLAFCIAAISARFLHDFLDQVCPLELKILDCGYRLMTWLQVHPHDSAGMRTA